MPDPLTIAAIAGPAVLGALFGKRKGSQKIPSWATFYRQYRQDVPQEFGLTSEEFAQAYGGGTRLIRDEREAAIARAARALPQNSVARGLVPIQAAAQSQQAFGELVQRIMALNARTAIADKQQYQQDARYAYEADLRRIQLEMDQEAQDEAFYANFVNSIVDPLQKVLLLRELENLDKANLSKTGGIDFNTFETFEPAGEAGPIFG